MVVGKGIYIVSTGFHNDHMRAYNERWFLLHHLITENLELCFCIQVVYEVITF